MDIYFIRHTKPAIAAGTCYGQADIPLADSFVAEYAGLRQKIQHLRTARVYSSPLQRCLQLAECVAQSANFGSVQIDARLKELNFGDWEMQAWQDIPLSAIEEWASDYVAHAPPNGESFATLHLRARQFLMELCIDADAPPALIFTHAGVIRAVIAEIQQSPLSHAFDFKIDYAGITKVMVTPDAIKLTEINV